MSEYKNRRILLVDDHAGTRKVVWKMLRNRGFSQLCEASNGEEALEVLEQQKIDLVMADWDMPKMSGLELTRWIRNHPKHKMLPVMMVTADENVELIVDAVRAGINNYVIKTFDEITLVDKITKIFESRLIYKENQEIWEHLKNSRVFGHLPENLIKGLIPLSNIFRLAKGSVLLEEGQANSRVFFLLEGKVGVYAKGGLILQLRRKGDIIGEMSVISSKPCAATVIAETPVQLFSLHAKDIGRYTDIDAEQLQNILYRIFALILTDKLTLTTHHAQLFETKNQMLEELRETSQQHQKRLQYRNEVLTKENSYFQATFQAMEEGLITTDEHKNIQVMNAAAETLTGWIREKALGRQLFEVLTLISETTGEFLPSPLKMAEENNENASWNTCLLISQQGIQELISYHVRGVYSDHNKIQAWVLTLRKVGS
ncbi:response regulator [Deltaproteobacteria bacterium TL4]